MFFKFIWPSGKHHVKKDVLIQGIENGGLKMPDINAMVKAINLTWVNRLVTKNNTFTNMFKALTGITNPYLFFQMKQDISHITKYMPSFYKQIANNWFSMYSVQPDSPKEILTDSLWCNKFILVDDKPIYFRQKECNPNCFNQVGK